MKNIFRKLFPTKEIREYCKTCRKYRKMLIKTAKHSQPFDYGWLDEFVRIQIKFMHEYFTKNNNVWQTDETRLPIIEQLQHVLDLCDELDNVWDSHTPGHIKNDDGSIAPTEESTNSYIQISKKQEELYEEIYSYIGKYIQWWWD